MAKKRKTSTTKPKAKSKVTKSPKTQRPATPKKSTTRSSGKAVAVSAKVKASIAPKANVLPPLPESPSSSGTEPTAVVKFPQPRPKLVRPGTFGMVFGGDDRQLVQNTLVYPNRAICYLRVYFGNKIFGGTGFLVGERALVTAAHCVHDDHFDKVGKATRIEIIPAAYLDAQRQLIAPYGYAELDYSACRVPQEWIQNTPEQALSHDYALIQLPSSHAFGKKLGYFGLTPIGPELDTTLLQYPSYYLYGYPVKNPPPGWFPGMPGWAAGPLQSIQGNRTHYLIDMTPGQSGGPLFYQYGAEANGTPKVGVLAINHYESTVSNSAVVIRPAIFQRLIGWRDEIL